MKEKLGSTDFPVIDKHGKTLWYTPNRQDPHYDNNVIAIGDSVSTINPLAFEGIRHAMQSARIATKHIVAKLENPKLSFKSYEKELHHYFGFKWRLSEMLMKIFFQEPNDKNTDLLLDSLGTLSFDEMFNLAFHYKFGTTTRLLTKYASLKIGQKIKVLFS